jgi:hypothetical protein
MPKTKFSTFQLNEGSDDYRIPHVEDLNVEQFIKAIENLHKQDAVQKLDGANLRAGLDEDGKLYVSREQKGGKRWYKLSQFPKRSSSDGFMAAFAVLQQVEEQLKTIVVPGEALNLEVIYGSQPNTVFYGKDNLNYLAILEMVTGDDPSLDLDQSKVGQLVELLGKQVIHVQTIASDTTDGVQISRAPKTTDWKIIKSKPVDTDKVPDFGEKLGELKKFLNYDNKAAAKLGKDLTNFEVIKSDERELSDEKKRLNQKIYDEWKLPIKQDLLKLVSKQKPSYQGTIGDEGAYEGIEGIIFTDPKTREKFKVVDKDIFTAINKFNYRARYGVYTRTVSTDPDLPKEAHGGILGEARLRSIKMFGLEHADLPNNAKRTIEKFRGGSREDTVKNIARSLHQLHFEAVKRKIQAIYVSALDDLDEALDSFKTNASEYSLKLKNGKTITYTAEIKRRTLLVFAEARKTILEMLSQLRSCQEMTELIELFFSRQLDDLFGRAE